MALASIRSALTNARALNWEASRRQKFRLNKGNTRQVAIARPSFVACEIRERDGTFDYGAIPFEDKTSATSTNTNFTTSFAAAGGQAISAILKSSNVDHTLMEVMASHITCLLHQRGIVISSTGTARFGPVEWSNFYDNDVVACCFDGCPTKLQIHDGIFHGSLDHDIALGPSSMVTDCVFSTDATRRNQRPI
jgi:hypothetical protein